MISTSSPVIELTESLIAKPSVTPHDAGCLALIASHLTTLGFSCEELNFGEVCNLFARLGTAEPLLVFVGHTDVVPTGPESQWTSPPFIPTIRDNMLYGRGTCDMKSAIAAMICAVQTFLQQHSTFNGSIGFLLTSDEEGPSINGTRKVIEVLQKRSEKITYCLVGEPSSDTTVGDQIRIGRRGSLHGKLNVYGKQGHVAHPHLAVNPIHSSALALHELANTVWDSGNEHFPPTTFQISNIHSGTGASNVVPGHLETLFNFRYSTASTVDELQARTRAVLDAHHFKYDIDWNEGAQPFLTQHGKLISATQQAIHEVTGLTTKLSTGGGTSDGRFIAPTGAEVVELGVSHATAHHIDECVKIDDLIKLTKIYERLLELLLLGSVDNSFCEAKMSMF